MNFMLFFFNKISQNDILLKKNPNNINFIYSEDLIRIIDFNRAEPTCYITSFPYASSSLQNGAFWYIELGVILPSHDLILELWRNCGGLSRMGAKLRYMGYIASFVAPPGRNLVPFSVRDMSGALATMFY